MGKQQDYGRLDLQKVIDDAIQEHMQQTKVHLHLDGYTLCGHYGRGSLVTSNRRFTNCKLCLRFSKS